MSPITVGLIGFAFLFGLLTLGVPVAVCMAIVGLGGLWYFVGPHASLVTIVVTPLETVSSYALAVLPLFLLMAHICFASGLSRDIFDLARKWLGHQRGGVAMATVAGCAGFAAISASSMATASTMGLAAIPEMKRLKYDPALATGAVAAGGTIGILIPPSGALIIYGIITETSIGRLFIAGMIPGILEAVFYMITIYILCLWKPSLGPPGPSFSLREKMAAFGSCGEVVGLIILVLGGLLVGWFTPTEAGAVGAFGAILFSLIRRRLSWKKFADAILETMKTTGLIYAILIGANILIGFIALSTIPTQLSNAVGALPLPPLAIMGVMILVYLFLGCFIDVMAMILLTIPIFFPLALSLGFDPIWFGIIIVRVMEMALITPPVGMNVYIIAGVAPDVPMQTIFKGIIPFLIADVFHVALLLFVPAIVLFLPSLMMG